MSVLVSVCIITYNSSKTVVETLDSIKAQDYKEIELIISDDCSKDNTIEIINNWLSQNSARFVNTKLITAEKNHGTAINLNTAIKNSTGEWIKILAGDDLLTENCISVFMHYVQNRPETDFFVSRIQAFSEDKTFNVSNVQKFYDILNKQQHKSKKAKEKLATYKLIYPGPAWFFSRKIYNTIGGLDESYSMLDETPFTFYIVQSGFEIIPIDEQLVKYRVAATSASRTGISATRKSFLEQDKKFFFINQLPVMKKKCMFIQIWDQKIYYYLLQKQLTKLEKTGIYDTKILRWQKVLSPFTLWTQIIEKLL